MTLSGEELERIDAKIRSLAEAYLSTGKPYLLSRLGKDLGDDLKIVKLGYGRSLGDYITERLANYYAIILMGEHKNIQALVRSSEQSSTDIPLVPDQKRVPRYNYRFWAAFSVPMKDDNKRWLNLDDFTFRDIDEKPEGDHLEIPSTFVAPEEVEDRDSIVKVNITKWLESEGLSPERFIAKPQPAEGRAVALTGGRTLLEAVIQTLDRRQLAATTLSLDVVADLLRRRL